MHQEATQCLESAGMSLQEWNSSHQGFNQFVNDDKRKITPSILGVTWDTSSDLLYIKPVYVDPVDALTKRKALSICSKLYDPLGLISPITIKGKLFIRSLWKLKVDWDEFLGEEVIVEFNRSISDYRDLSCIVFPRAVATKTTVNILHIFCDASSNAYGTVAYVCNELGSNLLMSRSRVAPVKTVYTTVGVDCCAVGLSSCQLYLFGFRC